MGDDAKPGMREFYFGKRARRHETQRRLKNAHSRATLKHFRDIAQLCLIILNVKNGKTKRYLLLGVCHFFFVPATATCTTY